MDREAWRAESPWGCKKSDTTERLNWTDCGHEGPGPWTLRTQVAGPVTQETQPSGRLLGRRAEPRYFPDSTCRMKLWRTWKRVWSRRCMWNTLHRYPWFGRWDRWVQPWTSCWTLLRLVCAVTLAHFLHSRGCEISKGWRMWKHLVNDTSFHEFHQYYQGSCGLRRWCLRSSIPPLKGTVHSVSYKTPRLLPLPPWPSLPISNLPKWPGRTGTRPGPDFTSANVKNLLLSWVLLPQSFCYEPRAAGSLGLSWEGEFWGRDTVKAPVWRTAVILWSQLGGRGGPWAAGAHPCLACPAHLDWPGQLLAATCSSCLLQPPGEDCWQV